MYFFIKYFLLIKLRSISIWVQNESDKNKNIAVQACVKYIQYHKLGRYKSEY